MQIKSDVLPDLGPDCLQMLSADDKSRQQRENSENRSSEEVAQFCTLLLYMDNHSETQSASFVYLIFFLCVYYVFRLLFNFCS